MDLLEREAALADLEAALDAALRGHGRVVLVSGEAGIGKTSLVERFGRTQRTGVRVLWGGCDALVTPRALGPWHDIASQTGGSLAERLSVPTPRDALFGSLLQELQRLPTLTIVEDLHWADEATLDVLRYIGRRIELTSSVLVLTYRDDEIGSRHPLRRLLGDLASSSSTLRIYLAALSEPAVAALIGGRAIDPAALHRQTGGNPFYVTEILANTGTGLPLSIRDAVLGRMGRLSGSARALVEAAAVAGTRTESWLLEAILPADIGALDECLAGGVLREQGDRFEFRHELARQAVLDSIPVMRRAELHRLALRALESLPRGRAELTRLAYHADGAGDSVAIRSYLPAAAREASAAGAHRAAADLLAKGLRHAAQLPDLDLAGLYEAHAMECYHVAEMPDAITSWRHAIDLWRRQDNRLREGMNLAILAAALASAGQRDEAGRANLAAIELLAELPPGRELGLAYGTQAILHQYSHELSESIELAERAISLAQQAGDRQILVMAYDTLGMSWMFQDYARGCQYLERACDVARKTGLDAEVARALGDLGAVSVQLLQLDRAEHYLTEGLAFTAERDLHRTRLFTLAWMALAHLFRGRWSEAESAASEVLARPASSSARAVSLQVLGRLAARRGEPGTASQLLDQAISIAGAPHELRLVGPIRAARAEAAGLARDPAASCAEADLGYGLALAKRHSWLAGEFAYWRWRSGTPLETADWIAAPFRLQISGNWRAAAELWHELGCPYEQARALAEGDFAAQQQAPMMLDRLGARPAAADLRRSMRTHGVRRIPRGPRSTTRANRFGLTSRQLEILSLLAEGFSNTEIARRMSIAPKTAEHHVAAVMAKLEVISRQAAVKLAREQQLIR